MVARTLIILAALCLLSACTRRGEPSAAVERYLQAKVSGDEETIRRLLCRAMEGDYERERRSFEGVNEAHLEGMDCQGGGDSSFVRCQGKIVAAYGVEQSEFPLTAYRVTWEDGEWKWCGEAP